MTSNHAFWRDLLPTGEHYIRTVNLAVVRYVERLESSSTPRFHGIVNELAFRLFERSTHEGATAESLDETAIQEELARAVSFIRTFRQHGRGPLPSPSQVEIQEAVLLAERTAAFFARSSSHPLATRPRFPGCGWLSECEGDVMSSSVLYEIKAGERAFRTQDIKQVLVYCALNFASKAYDIRDICLLNPREGTYFAESLNSVCQMIAGRSALDVLGDIVEYASQSGDGYVTG